MAARVIDAKGCLFVGTPKQIMALIDALGGRGAATLDLKGAKFLVLEKAPDADEIVAAMKKE